MPGSGACTIVLDTGFLATGWGNGSAVGNPSTFLDGLINFYRSHGYEVVTNTIIHDKFLSDQLPSDLRAARQSWWNAQVTAGNIRVEPIVGDFTGAGAGERSLLKETIPGLAREGDLSHVKLFASDDFLLIGLPDLPF